MLISQKQKYHAPTCTVLYYVGGIKVPFRNTAILSPLTFSYNAPSFTVCCSKKLHSILLLTIPKIKYTFIIDKPLTNMNNCDLLITL